MFNSREDSVKYQSKLTFKARDRTLAMSNQPEKQSGELRRAGSQIPSQATASAAAAAVAAPTFFSRTSTFSKTLTEREKTIVTEMFDSRQRNATRTMLDNLMEKRPEDEDANEQEVEPGSEEVAGTKTEAQPQGEQATAEVDVEKRRRKKRRRLKPGEFDFSDVTDPRNLTQLTQLRLRPHELQGSWSQKLYSLVCRRLSLAPRQYIRDTLAKAKLVLANKFSQSEEILSIAVSMTDNRTLTCVEIVDNKLDTKSIAYLCHAVWECASINSFTLAGNEFTDEGLSIVIELLVATRHLHTVSLRDNRIRDVHGPKIAELLEQNRSITNLDLSYNQLGDTAAQYIGPALAENDRVRHLNLNWNCFRSVGVRLLTRNLNENIALRELTLKMNGLGIEGAGYVAKYLATNETLFSIDLSSNRIGDFGFELISKMVAKNYSLKEIKIGHNTVSTSGVYKVLEAFHRNKDSDLRILDFEGLYMDKKCLELIDAIKEERPHTYFVMHGTIERGTEHKTKELIRGIIDHDSPLEILRFYVEQTGSRLVDVFNIFDTEKNNAITKSDLVRGLEKINVIFTQEQVDILFDELDADKSGDIDFGELMAGDREARKNLRRKGKFHATAVNQTAVPDFVDI